ncbi:hypothetical protein O181_056627 [Austropuccinia psidii MF-1]|uniref:Uncharacterized protein n=1 Tax=Austropuccinia psidii MF-1 TaxID=1389203 RepID=A0A9Q3HUM4_9BASI|nr:hypothetical protein [Austropuccinia psidii MF-1]
MASLRMAFLQGQNRGRLLMVRKSRCGWVWSSRRFRENAGSIPAAHIGLTISACATLLSAARPLKRKAALNSWCCLVRIQRLLVHPVHASLDKEKPLVARAWDSYCDAIGSHT